ncbi:MAG: transposase [Anaerolineae bacterium]
MAEQLHYGVVHAVDNLFTEFFLARGAEADARRARAIPKIAQDTTRIPDLFALILLPSELRPEGPTPVVRSDNGLIYQSRRFRAACRDYRLHQEFITPYTPEQNGIIERFFRSLKEECVWQHVFASFEHARREISAWIRWYNEERPHQALGYHSPREFWGQQLERVA